MVIGDGEMPSWVKDFCRIAKVQYFELPNKKGDWGAHARNYALDLLDQESLADYVIFLDDDNILFPNSLDCLNNCSRENPPLIYQPIIHFRRWDNGWWILPTEMPPKKCFWDTLNGCYRSDIIKGVRWTYEYEHDFSFTQEAIKNAKTDIFVRSNEGPCGVHL
jgi:hypothetical protein